MVFHRDLLMGKLMRLCEPWRTPMTDIEAPVPPWVIQQRENQLERLTAENIELFQVFMERHSGVLFGPGIHDLMERIEEAWRGMKGSPLSDEEVERWGPVCRAAGLWVRDLATRGEVKNGGR